MTTNVLLASGERKAVGLFAIHVDGTPDNSARHQSKVRLGACENAVQRTATGYRATQWLTLTNNDVSAIMAGGFHNAKRDGLDANDQGRVLSDNLLNRNQALIEHTQRIGLFEVHAARTSCLGQRLEVKGSVVVVVQHSDVDFGTLTVIVHHGEFVGWRER